MKKLILNISCLALLALYQTGCVGMGGEQISLSHDQLIAPAQKCDGNIDLRKPVIDNRSRKECIGIATATVFASETGTITTDSDIKEQISEQIKQALETIGYNIKVTEGSNNVTSKVILLITIDGFWFKNYNWFWPVVPTSGNIQLTLKLEDTSGKILFDKIYNTKGSSYCLSGHCAFEAATKEAMTELLNKIVEDFSSNQVRSVIESANKSS